mmetsp:Transcript_16774/g.27177  ORF Transcript_16774/g.27177 Transcript_16774/m.27177 type:complete len:376 (-) Transcript_16774:1210-2337(-)
MIDKFKVVVACVVIVLIRIYRNLTRSQIVVLNAKGRFEKLLADKARLREYKPFFIQSGFFQSVLFNLFFPAPDLVFKRQHVEFKDGGAASLDWHKNTNTEVGNTVALIFPALGTSCRTKYIRHLVKYFSEEAKFSCVVLNVRGSAGTDLVSNKLYNMTKNDDIHELVMAVQCKRPGAKLVAVGASMGSNIMVKYLCDREIENHPVQAAVSISNPFDLKGIMEIEQHFPFNLRYFREMFEGRFVKWFKRRLSKFGHLFDDPDSDFELDVLLGKNCMQSFTEYACKHFFNYDSFQEYLSDASCTNYVENLQVPTLFIQSLDDPLVPRQLIPEDKLLNSKNATLLLTHNGGHIAFLDRHLRCWFLPLSRAFLQTNHAI